MARKTLIAWQIHSHRDCLFKTRRIGLPIDPVEHAYRSGVAKFLDSQVEDLSAAGLVCHILCFAEAPDERDLQWNLYAGYQEALLDTVIGLFRTGSNAQKVGL